MITTKRLTIQLTNMNDLEDIYEYVKDEEVMKYEREDYSTIESFEKILEILVKHELLYSVRLLNSSKVIGHLFLGKTHPEVNNEYNLGYIFHPLYQGKGYCTEACKVIVDYGFQSLHANRVRAACNPENIPSWKVMEKIGLIKEGYFKKRFFIKNDEFGNPIYTDEVVYGIQKEDWNQKRL